MNIMHGRFGPIQTNCYIVSDDEKNCAIIDPGAEANRINKILEENQLNLKAILLTHGHFDHIGAVKGLKAAHPEAQVIIGAKDEPMLAKAAAHVKDMLGGYADASDYIGLSADRTVSEGDVIEVGAMKFSVLETPGHTRGGVCYLSEEYLFSGDTLFRQEVGRTDLEGGDYPTLLKSLKKLAELEGNPFVLPGHEDFSELNFEREHNFYIRQALS